MEVVPNEQLGRSFRLIASRVLAEMFVNDPRIVVATTAVDDDFRRPWFSAAERLFVVDSEIEPAITWCARAAAGGSRPFVFLSWDELQNSHGQIRPTFADIGRASR